METIENMAGKGLVPLTTFATLIHFHFFLFFLGFTAVQKTILNLYRVT